MKRSRLLAAILLLALAGGAAFLLRDAVYRAVLLPAAYLWWGLGVYYRLLPQVVLWILLILIVFFVAVGGSPRKAPASVETRRAAAPSAGPIEQLAMQIAKRRYGNYYKWLVAKRLADLALEILDQREGRRSAARYTRLAARDWTPPADVMEYLEVGLNGSFADYPRPHWLRPRRTPLDLPPSRAIALLESEMEEGGHGDR